MQGTTIEIPLVIVTLGGVVLASVLVAMLPMSRFTGKPLPMEALQTRMGLEGLNAGLFFVAMLMWSALFVLLFGGLVWTIYDIVTALVPEDGEGNRVWAWRFSVLKLASLTAVLGAVVALPFTLVRLGLTRAQVDTAKDALFNDKIDVAVTDLYAQRQVTLGPDDEGKFHNGWEDDITRRNGAIDRLEGLVTEDATLSPRISRMLSVYVRELSRSDAIAETYEGDLESEELEAWVFSLSVKRSDMEKAVQTLGRLPVDETAGETPVRPELPTCNLQRFSLWGSNFEKADLSAARLQGADLSRARFDQDTSLTAVTLRGAAVREVDFNMLQQIEPHLEHLFGDVTVKLPEGMRRPDHFNNEYEDWDDFITAWRAFQRSIGQDPDNPT